MNYTIKLKGGVKNDIPVLSPREIGICTDTNEVFVGTETGNKDFFKSINDKIGNGFTTENTITSLMNAITQNITNLESNKANKEDLIHSESGIWTPTIVGSTTAGTANYTKQVGTFYRIGNIVYCSALITANNISGIGSIFINGLPFATKNDGNYRAAGNIAYIGGISVNENYNTVMLLLADNATSINVFQSSNITSTSVTDSNLQNKTLDLMFSVIYETN